MADIANSPITSLSGVGSQIAEKLKQLGIERLIDLLLHLPKSYHNKGRIIASHELCHGQIALVQGRVIQSQPKGKQLSVVLQDDFGRFRFHFFKTYPSLYKVLQVGHCVRGFGEVSIDQYGVTITHPQDLFIVTPQQSLPQGGLEPVYATVKGLTQNKLRQLIRQALAVLQQQSANLLALPSALLPEMLRQYTDYQALQLIHQPPLTIVENGQAKLDALIEQTHPAVRRLIIEELVAHQLSMLRQRARLNLASAPRCFAKSPLAQKLLNQLPFELTAAQQRVLIEIGTDLQHPSPMLRLLQGDVGSGKTLVAAIAACHAIDSGWQVAIMAPTEILARQHYLNFCEWFAPLGIEVGWLAGTQTGKPRKEAEQRVADNDVALVIGTHALFQEQVTFAKLGLVIIDEQHRFGVEQRLALADKGVSGTTPHQLMMTATPIPRTLAMSVYGEMDASIIDELPPGRTPITTVTVSRKRRNSVIERVAANCRAGKQAYWVCPLVDQSEQMDVSAAEATYRELDALLDIRVGLVHGKMKDKDKQITMLAFKAGDIDLLIATTVIEVGVNVPNASLMIIENAERLGLSQLHQLRGRVGRGAVQSYCVLMYQPNLSETSVERLNILKSSHDGFVIADADLKLRGPGELLGKRQTGNIGFYLSDLVRDEALLDAARRIAEILLHVDEGSADASVDIDMGAAARAILVDALIERWLPNRLDYASA